MAVGHVLHARDQHSGSPARHRRHGANRCCTCSPGEGVWYEIVYSNRNAISDTLAEELDCERLDLDELLATSDIVSLHCPYSTATHHLIGTEQLALMRADSLPDQHRPRPGR